MKADRNNINLIKRDFIKMQILKKASILLINIYQKLSKPLPRVCRFYPSCSEYTKQAIDKYGFLNGCRLGILRIIKCHPLNPGGFDPVP